MAGRAAGLARLLPSYAATAWRGLVGARVGAGEAVVQAVVREGGLVLLALRGDVRGWEIPGGAPAPGEGDAEALRREVREETGLEVEVGALVGTYRRSGFLPHEARVYRCRPVGGAPRPGPETRAVRWCPEGALPATLLPWCRAPLRDALAAGEGAPVERREHQGLAALLESVRIDLRVRLGRDAER